MFSKYSININKMLFLVLNRKYTIKNILSLSERNFIEDIFPSNVSSEIKTLTVSIPQTVYAGFDPTAKSLHIGNLLILMGLLHCQRAGHQPIALLGGATALIGDPSGRNQERSHVDSDVTKQNLYSLEQQIRKIFCNHEKYFCDDSKEIKNLKELRIINNAQWYSSIQLVNFISDIGRHFRMGSMLSRTSVQSRMKNDAGLSFTEFTYQIFQAYDWLYLFQKFGCRFQLGGSDQMGNIMTGHELISRIENKSVYGLTLPIITNEEGNKFGKTAGNAIWLNEESTSAFGFYQFFIRVADSEVEKLLKFFTFLPLKDIKEIIREHKRVPELREAQKILAQNITLLVHGEQGLRKAEMATNALYKGNIDAIEDLNCQDIKNIFTGATICEILLEPGLTFLELALKAKCFITQNDAIRIISAGGFYVNQKRASNISEIISPGIHILKNGLTMLRVGKRNYYIIKWLK